MKNRIGLAALAAVLSLGLLAGCQDAAQYRPGGASGEEPTAALQTGASTTAVAPGPAAYRAIYDAVSPLLQPRAQDGAAEFGLDDARNTGAKAAGTKAPNANAQGGAGDHSDTNIQVEGVQEADIIKTDGAYIYLLSTENLVIVRADGAQTRVVSRIPLAAEQTIDKKNYSGRIRELYVTGDRLVLIRQSYENFGYTDDDKPLARDTCCIRYGDTLTEALFYDIRDRAQPKLAGRLGQSGGYLSSRMVGTHLYIASSYWLGGEPDVREPGTYVPRLLCGGIWQPVPADSVRLNGAPASSQYLVITGTDAASPDRHLSSQSVLDGGENLYASLSNLYVAACRSEPVQSGWETVTRLTRFSMDKGVVRAEAAGQVEGQILNQFSMDEYKGHFRIVTTSSRWQEYRDGKAVAGFQAKEGNNLYVLDASLKTVGKIENLAPGERVYSVRFDGDIGYFVTFRQVDPLFAVDLKVPAAPQVLSKLKIPGFSEYLHPWSGDLLFGLGKDANETSGRTTGMKLSMFRVADPQNVTEESKALLGKEYVYSEASYNHKAVLIDPRKNLIAFPAQTNSGKSRYMVYAYDAEKGFVRRGEITPDTEAYPVWMRGLYSGDTLYVVTPERLSAYRLSDLQRTARLTLK